MKFSVIIPTYRRSQQLCTTLQKLNSLEPRPDQVLVHVDAGDSESELILAEFPDVIVLKSQVTVGPGGGRNKLVAAATTEWVVSLDDDSWPVDHDFFAKAAILVANSGAQMIACNIQESGGAEFQPHDEGRCIPSASFVGCGCVFSRSAFISTGGYVPLRYAYGMEENDVAIKLLDGNYNIVFAPQLRVFHDCDREKHHASPRINAAQIANTILFGYLRYPVRYWPIAFLQFCNRIIYSVRKKRYHGVLSGILAAPFVCWKNRTYRKAVSVEGYRRFRKLRERVPQSFG